MSCTAAMSGNVSSAIHSVAYPYAAPATEYVEIPDGSSSAAPVMTPVPKQANLLRRRAGLLRLWAPPSGSASGSLCGSLSGAATGGLSGGLSVGFVPGIRPSQSVLWQFRALEGSFPARLGNKAAAIMEPMLDYRRTAETCSGCGLKTVASAFAVHTPATPLPTTSNTAVLAALLAKDPVLSTSASASKDPHASPAPRLSALTCTHRPHFAACRRSTSHCASPTPAPPITPIVPKLTARARTPSIRKLIGPPATARPICSTRTTPSVSPTAIPTALPTTHHAEDEICRRITGHCAVPRLNPTMPKTIGVPAIAPSTAKIGTPKGSAKASPATIPKTVSAIH